MGRTPAGRTREKIYRFMRGRLLQGRAPTVREVQERFGFRAVQSAREHLERLVEEGRLDKRPGEARGYRLPGRETPIRMVPVLGRVPAGPVDLAVEDLEGYVSVSQDSVPQNGGDGELFGLRIKGDSMRDAGILDGDLAVVRKQDHAENRDVVVALVGEEATVKTLRRFGRGKSGRVELHPANPAYAPIVPDPDELSLLGKVIEIRRTL
jgi:repressor LexA